MNEQLKQLLNRLRSGELLTWIELLEFNVIANQAIVVPYNTSQTSLADPYSRFNVLSQVCPQTIPSRTLVQLIKTKYTGKTIKLIKMFDIWSPVDAGTKGLVTGVDDAGQLSVLWVNGRTLSVNFDAGDCVEILNGTSLE